MFVLLILKLEYFILVTFSVLHDLKKQLQVLRRTNSTDEIVKAVIAEAITRELNSISVEQIRDELTRIYQDKLISSDILKWAVSEVRKDSNNQITDGVVADDSPTLTPHSTPVELDNDDLYHATLCSSIVNRSRVIDGQECRRLLQSSSYLSLIKLSISQRDSDLLFPQCMIAMYSADSAQRRTICYIAFADFKFQMPTTDSHNSTFGDGKLCS